MIYTIEIYHTGVGRTDVKVHPGSIDSNRPNLSLTRVALQEIQASSMIYASHQAKDWLREYNKGPS
jgi:hypothetical protein